jgi:iron complex outermembrane receptor protein
MEKPMIRQLLKSLGSRRLVLVAGVAVPFFLGSSAFAQQPAASPATQLPENAPGPAAPPAPAAAGEASTERVVVTGSYIPTAEEVTAAPLDTLTPQEVRRSGTSDVLQVLQKRNPSFVGAGNLGSSNANIASGSTLGGAVASIRGFPTLVLYEGRRIADAAAIAVGGAQFSDVGIFPAALLSRIEVLKDGASALYGSDAVGGVINVFTKDEFQGAEVGFRYGTTVEGAVAERRGYAIAGIGNGTTQVTAGMQYYEMDPLFMRQRSYSNVAVGGTTTYGGTVRSASGRYLVNGFDPLNWPGQPVANSPFDAGVVPGATGPGVGFGAFPQYYHLGTFGDGGPNDVLNYNLARVPTSTLDTSRTNVIASFAHQVFGKQLELFGNFMYSNSDYRSFLNAQPLSNATGVIIPPGHVGTDQDPNSPTYDPTIYNPFDYQIDGSTLGGANRTQVNNRFNPNFPRIFDNTNNFYRFLGGVRSQINEDWFFETAAYYSKYDIEYSNKNLVIADQLNAMIAGTATDFNGAPIPPLDFFALNPIGNGPGQVSGAQFATIFGSNLRTLSSFQRVFDAKIVGFPFSLPAGKVGISFGGEYRVEGFKVEDSPEIFVGSVPIGLINKKRDIYSIFGEINIPLVSSAMKIPFIYNLEIGLAGRFDHYENIDEDAKVPKVALRYQPIKDLTFRATYSNSFIAPNLYQLFGPAGQGFSTTITLGGIVQDQAQVLVPSNPGLLPSTAESYTAGLVYSPSYIPGLTITVDWFHTLQLGIVQGLGGATILGSVDQLGPASPYYNLVAFNNFPGQPGAEEVGGPGSLNGNLASTFYIDQLRNAGASRAQGFDLSARYNIDFHNAGQLELGISAIVFTSYDFKTSPTSSYYNILGLDFPELAGGNPDYKLNAYAEYRLWGFTLGLNFQYIPEMVSAIGNNPEAFDQSDRTLFPLIDDWWSLDGRLSYTFKGRTTVAAVDTKDAKSMIDSKGGGAVAAGAETMSPMQKLLDGLTLTVGCNNMTNEQPPFIAGANSNTDLSLYDPYGRFVYFEVSKKF